jgi:hypothetical protein
MVAFVLRFYLPFLGAFIRRCRRARSALAVVKAAS